MKADLKINFFKTILHGLSISPLKIEEYASLFYQKKLKKNEYFIKENQLCSSFAYVFSGVLRSYILDFDGIEANLRFLKQNDLVAGSFGKNAATNTNIQCIDDSVLFVASWKDVNIYNKENKWLSEYFNHFLSSAHDQITRRMASYIRLNAKERYLLFLKEHPKLLNQIPQYYIASYLGITPIQLSRIRKEIAKGN